MDSRQEYAGLEPVIEEAWTQRAALSPDTASEAVVDAVETVLDGLEGGALRVAEPLGPPGEWRVNQWLKKAVLLAFRVHANEVIEAGFTRFFDKLPLRWGGERGGAIEDAGARVVPPATVRRGAHIGHDAVLMLSLIHISEPTRR